MSNESLSYIVLEVSQFFISFQFECSVRDDLLKLLHHSYGTATEICLSKVTEVVKKRSQIKSNISKIFRMSNGEDVKNSDK